MTTKDSKKKQAKFLEDGGKELRCSRFGYRLFGRVVVVNDETRTNLLEFKCKECSKAVNRQFSHPPDMEYEVFHYYDMEFNLIESDLRMVKKIIKKEVEQECQHQTSK